MGSRRAGTLDLWLPKGKDSVEDSFPGPGEGLCVLEISTGMGNGGSGGTPAVADWLLFTHGPE